MIPYKKAAFLKLVRTTFTFWTTEIKIEGDVKVWIPWSLRRLHIYSKTVFENFVSVRTTTVAGKQPTRLKRARYLLKSKFYFSHLDLVAGFVAPENKISASTVQSRWRRVNLCGPCDGNCPHEKQTSPAAAAAAVAAAVAAYLPTTLTWTVSPLVAQADDEILPVCVWKGIAHTFKRLSCPRWNGVMVIMVNQCTIKPQESKRTSQSTVSPLRR